MDLVPGLDRSLPGHNATLQALPLCLVFNPIIPAFNLIAFNIELLCKSNFTRE